MNVSGCYPTDEGEFCFDDYRGKWIVLYFYPKDNTPGCTVEAKEFTELLPEFEKLNAIVVGVSRDSPKSHRKFREKHNLKHILISDQEGRLINLFGVFKKKKRFGREYMGIERSTFLIDPHGNVVKEWRGIKAKGHAETVLKELRAASSAQQPS